METQYLKTLHTVVKTGSFSLAASDLCITQSAVSQRIKFLEERYGLSLVDRSGQSVTPTEAGRIVLQKTEQILLLEKELEAELNSLGRKSRLAFCCTPTFGIVYLPKVLNKFFLSNSDDLDFKFVLNPPEQSLKGLLSNEFHMAVIEHCNPVEAADVVTMPLPPDDLVFISSPSLAIPTELSLEELLQQRLIARREGCSSRHLLQKNLAEHGRSIDDFKGIIMHDDLHLTIQTVLAGSGIAFVSRSLVKDQIQRGQLHEHMVKGFNCTRYRTIIFKRRHSENPTLIDFVSHIKAVLPGC
ncbi:helix-turn-helix transcriptional regulator, LysR family [Geotalea daltonii FRC-32]|uniref:Helix-turn-helix transcriptional regulator, LysR family n=1 Tax=Geotalea daltonii (strain DSM 22248 / JCM 15807 / FRC-32) TaxID=316067 RepID=B9M6N2_GEODF|nr:LysR family transcriptional regulator [Geotalea daltonii]ACM20092.1 helix-turn-helix transcriptional regulator, LysR family [Geotalea daltonii FRC-32]